MARGSCLSALVCVWLVSAARAEPDGGAAVAPMSLYHLTATWTDASGHPVKLASFAGAPVVLGMIFTRCQGACPMLVEDLKALQRALPVDQRARVRFVLVSFDPKRDTPERLSTYAREHGLQGPSWTLLTGDEEAVSDLAAAIGLSYRATPGGAFTHSNLITVLDAQGVVVHQTAGLKQDPKPVLRALAEASAHAGPH